MDEKDLNQKTCAFVVALSEDKGLVQVSSYPRSIDKFRFIEFLGKIRKSYGSQPIGIYLDNASFHKAKVVTEFAEKNNVELIFSPAYSPEIQPSESLIGYLKQYIKKKRL